MKLAFAAWLTSASIASVTKSMNMISTTGRRPGHRGADGGADNGGFGNRRVAHPLGAELFQKPAGDAKRATRLCDILAEQDDRRIGVIASMSARLIAWPNLT